MIILCCPVHNKVRGSDYGVTVQLCTVQYFNQLNLIINNQGFV